jgi:hypothetical protein
MPGDGPAHRACGPAVDRLEHRVDKLGDQVTDVKGWLFEDKVNYDSRRYPYGELSQVKLVRGDDLEKMITELDRPSALTPERSGA